MRFLYWPRWGGGSYGFHFQRLEDNVRQALPEIERSLLEGNKRVVITARRNSLQIETEPARAKLALGWNGLRHWWFRFRAGTRRDY